MKCSTVRRSVDFETASACTAEARSKVAARGTGETVSTMAADGLTVRSRSTTRLRLPRFSSSVSIRKSLADARADRSWSATLGITNSPVSRLK